MISDDAGAGQTSEVPLTAKRATPEAVAARMREGAAAAMRGSCRWQCASKSRTAEAARAGAWAMVGEPRWPGRRLGWLERCPLSASNGSRLGVSYGQRKMIFNLGPAKPRDVGPLNQMSAPRLVSGLVGRLSHREFAIFPRDGGSPHGGTGRFCNAAHSADQEGRARAQKLRAWPPHQFARSQAPLVRSRSQQPLQKKKTRFCSVPYVRLHVQGDGVRASHQQLNTIMQRRQG